MRRKVYQSFITRRHRRHEIVLLMEIFTSITRQCRQQQQPTMRNALTFLLNLCLPFFLLIDVTAAAATRTPKSIYMHCSMTGPCRSITYKCRQCSAHTHHSKHSKQTRYYCTRVYNTAQEKEECNRRKTLASASVPKFSVCVSVYKI